MPARNSSHRTGFTLIELLVVIAIIAVLFALLMSGVQAAREAANRAKCQNNLRQLIIAVHNFHENRGTMPTYFGIYPPTGTCGVRPGCNREAVYGSWFLHIAAYLDQDNLYRNIADEVKTRPMNERITLTPGTNCRPTQDRNYTGGHTRTYTICDVYPTYEEHGIWLPEVRTTTFHVLRCPTDPSASTNAIVSGWGPTSYLANYNAFDSGIRIPTTSPLWTNPPNFNAITDGLSNTIAFAEGYGNCDGFVRIALYSWHYHNFGLDWFQNPNTLMFQTRPVLKNAAQCPAGTECCDNWRAQTPHSVMNVALADGSVRSVSRGINPTTWDNALLPRDGNTLGNDW